MRINARWRDQGTLRAGLKDWAKSNWNRFDASLVVVSILDTYAGLYVRVYTLKANIYKHL